jgi:aminopeptidase
MLYLGDSLIHRGNMTPKKQQELLRKYAEAVIRVGLNLRAGQRLIITLSATRGVPITAAPFVREVVKAAYATGARYVDVIWGDEETLRLRAQNAPRDSADEYSTWHINGLMNIIERGDALLSIHASDPDLFGGLDADFVGAMQKVHLKNYAAVSAQVSRNAINWCVIAASSKSWAVKIFPKLTAEKAEAKLWKEIFAMTRIDQPDPIAAWQEHIQNLSKRSRYLQAKEYTGLHYKSPDTDLTLGLPRGHKWVSAQSLAENGVVFTANMPTEEVFTLPDRQRADGTVKSTFPLNYDGTLIDDFMVKFEGGRIVQVGAKKGEAALKQLVEMDEGSTRLGEVALVPASSPIAKTGHLFYDTLFDENASCHLAIGYGLRFTLTGGEELTDEEFQAAGGNNSIAHVDFMIGSNKMDIDGIKDDGTREPVMRKGEWAFNA